MMVCVIGDFNYTWEYLYS